MSVNYATFSGTITRKSIRQGVSPNGKAWAQFGLAVGSSSYDKETGAYKKEPTFYCNCVVFGKLADTINPVLQEGASLLVSGHFANKGYNTASGDEGIKHEMICDNVAVNCVPWQTITVTVNNSNTMSTGSSQTVQSPSVQQTSVQAQQQMQMPGMNPQVSGAWNTIPMTAQQQYSMSGAAALGIPDDPSF